jgi:hypothetical protein
MNLTDMNLSVHAIVFVVLLVVCQSLLTLWSFRRGGSVAVGCLVAFLPLVGVPYLLYRQRGGIQDNHIAGALTYLTLLVGAFAFLTWYPKAMEDDIPWALIHTMQFFAFLGLANLIFSPFRE